MKSKGIVISLLIFSFAFLGINGVKAETECPHEHSSFGDYLTYKNQEDGTLFLIRNYKDENTVVLDENKLQCTQYNVAGEDAEELFDGAKKSAQVEKQKRSLEKNCDNLYEKPVKHKIEWSSGNTELTAIFKIDSTKSTKYLDVWNGSGYETDDSIGYKALGIHDSNYSYFVKINTTVGSIYAISDEKPNKVNFEKILSSYCRNAGTYKGYKTIGKIQSYYNSRTNETSDLTVNLPKQEYKSFYDEEDNTYYKCGDLTRIPKGVPKFTNLLYRLIKVIVPIILVVMGTSDFLRAVSANDEKSMDETPKKFARRIGAAVLIYFVMTMVQLIIKVIDTDNKSSVLSCAKCFVSSEKKCETYNYSFGQANEGTGSEAKSSKEGGGSNAGGKIEGGGFR